MNKYDVLGVVGEGAYGVVLKCKNKDLRHTGPTQQQACCALFRSPGFPFARCNHRSHITQNFRKHLPAFIWDDGESVGARGHQ